MPSPIRAIASIPKVSQWETTFLPLVLRHARCHHPQESWLCLCCKELLCSHFVNKYVLEYYHQMNHSLALSYSDSSIWCFACDAYLDAEVIPQLRLVHETAYILKFGEAPPLRIKDTIN